MTATISLAAHAITACTWGTMVTPLPCRALVSKRPVEVIPRFRRDRDAMHVGSLFALFHHASVVAQEGWLILEVFPLHPVHALPSHFLKVHVNCRVNLAGHRRIELGFRQSSLNHMHHYPYDPTLDNFTLDRIFQRCSVHRSLSGVALLLEAANAGGYRRCQHSWFFRTLLLAAYAAHA